MADFIITIRPEPDASRDVDWLRRHQVPAMAVPVMSAKQQSFDLPDTPPFQAIIFTSRHAVAAIAGINGIASIDRWPRLGRCGHYRSCSGTPRAARQAGFDDEQLGPVMATPWCH